MPDQKPEIVITYCTQCQWLLRAAWLAQELLSTFADELGRVSLEPGTGGVFRILCDGQQIWERKADGGFPEAKVLKQRVRDLIDPGRDLGHNDRRVRCAHRLVQRPIRAEMKIALTISMPPASMRSVGCSLNSHQANRIP